MAAIRHARERPSAVQIPQRLSFSPNMSLELDSITTAREASSGVVFRARSIVQEDFETNRMDEQRPFTAEYSDIYSCGFFTQSANIRVSDPRERPSRSVRSIAAGFRQKVGRRLRSMSNDLKSRKRPFAANLDKTASTSRLIHTRFELPLVSPVGAEVAEEGSFILQTDYSALSDDGLAPPANRDIGDPARMAGVTVLDDGRAKYQLFAPAGEGGFATVYYAHAHPYLVANESLFPRVVAIKVFSRPRLAKEGISIHHAGNECKALQQATRSLNPFLTRLISTFYDAQNIYAVMHAYAGTLADRLCDTNRRMPAHEIKQLVAELVVGLQAVNEMGYIHRDLKSENVFLSPAGHLVVGDFTTVINPARRKRPGSEAWLAARLRTEIRPVGTPLRYAPEQLKARFYTSKVDLWAIGLMMLELFRGNCTETIFSRSEGEAYAGRDDILTKDLRPEINTFVDDEHARRLVCRLLSRDPATRPSICQIMNDLYFTSGREQDVEEYWRKIKHGDNCSLYYPPKIVIPKANNIELFFRTPEGEPSVPLEPGFDPAYRAYHYECEESRLLMDERVYGKLTVVEA